MLVSRIFVTRFVGFFFIRLAGGAVAVVVVVSFPSSLDCFLPSRSLVCLRCFVQFTSVQSLEVSALSVCKHSKQRKSASKRANEREINKKKDQSKALRFKRRQYKVHTKATKLFMKVCLCTLLKNSLQSCTVHTLNLMMWPKP